MTAFAAIRWAKAVPPLVRADGRPDQVAHHVLLVLATFANREGLARPSLRTLADETYLADKTVVAAMARLEAAGLIARAGELNGGTTVWRLNLTVTRDAEAARARDEQRERSRRLTAERVRRHRQRTRGVTPSETVTANAVGGRYVTPWEGVTDDAVTPPDGVSNAVGGRDKRRGRALLTPSPPLHPQVSPATTAIELPIELPLNCHTRGSAAGVRARAREPAQKRSDNGYTAEFEAAWVAYGRKGSKKPAFVEWQRATKRADLTVVTAAIGPYVDSTPEVRWRKDFERWLKGDCWESVVVPPQTASNGYQPWTNPADPADYHGELL